MGGRRKKTVIPAALQTFFRSLLRDVEKAVTSQKALEPKVFAMIPDDEIFQIFLEFSLEQYGPVDEGLGQAVSKVRPCVELQLPDRDLFQCSLQLVMDHGLKFESYDEENARMEINRQNGLIATKFTNALLENTKKARNACKILGTIFNQQIVSVHRAVVDNFDTKKQAEKRKSQKQVIELEAASALCMLNEGETEEIDSGDEASDNEEEEEGETNLGKGREATTAFFMGWQSSMYSEKIINILSLFVLGLYDTACEFNSPDDTVEEYMQLAVSNGWRIGHLRVLMDGSRHLVILRKSLNDFFNPFRIIWGTICTFWFERTMDLMKVDRLGLQTVVDVEFKFDTSSKLFVAARMPRELCQLYHLSGWLIFKMCKSQQFTLQQKQYIIRLFTFGQTEMAPTSDIFENELELDADDVMSNKQFESIYDVSLLLNNGGLYRSLKEWFEYCCCLENAVICFLIPGAIKKPNLKEFAETKLLGHSLLTQKYNSMCINVSFETNDVNCTLQNKIRTFCVKLWLRFRFYIFTTNVTKKLREQSKTTMSTRGHLKAHEEVKAS